MNKNQKIQELYSIRNEIFNEVDSMSIVPEEVKSIIYKAFQEMNEYYQNYGLDNSEILEYIYGNYNETMASITRGKGSDRRGVYWKQIDNLFDYLEEKILNGEEIQRLEVERFEINDDQRDRIVNVVVDILNDKLKDIQSRQNKLMERRDYSDKEIENVNNEIIAFIKNFIKESQIGINSEYERREKQLTSIVIDKVLERINELNSTEKTPEEMFKEGLSADLSLEDQRENAQRFTQNQQDLNRGKEDDCLPTDLIQ